MHDMRVFQAGYPLCFEAKLLDAVTRQLSMQHFDGRLRLQVDMLPQVDLSKASLAQ